MQKQLIHEYFWGILSLSDKSTLMENILFATICYSIGKSVEGRALWVLEFNKAPGQHQPGTPEVKFVAGIHGNDLVTQELLLELANHLCANYKKDYFVTEVLSALHY